MAIASAAMRQNEREEKSGGVSNKEHTLRCVDCGSEDVAKLHFLELTLATFHTACTDPHPLQSS